MGDMNFSAVVGALAVLLVYGVRYLVKAVKKSQGKSTGPAPLDERQQIIQLKGYTIAFFVFLVAYLAGWLLKLCGFTWFGSSFLEMFSPLAVSATFLVFWRNWYDTEYPLATPDAKRKSGTVAYAVIGLFMLAVGVFLLVLSGARADSSASNHPSSIGICFMLGVMLLAAPVAVLARKHHDKTRAALSGGDAEEK